jgi:16S rRNA (guanine966-N2)-methyltransferase
MRVTGGRLRGKPIAAPKGAAIRPTADRTRQSLFNILAHGQVATIHGATQEGARVLDAFAGTGALGLEALSRGAAQVTFIDNAPGARRILAQNIAQCGVEDASVVLRADATNPPPARQPADIAFLDPPYGAGLLVPALNGLRQQGWFAEPALIVAELGADEEIDWPEFAEQLDSRRYGAARIVFLRINGSTASATGANSRPIII